MEVFKLSRVFIDSKKFILGDVENIKFFSDILSDKDIIELHSMFTTPAIHHVVTKDQASGRSLMNSFLPFLQYYHRIGCLTLQKQKYAYNVVEILPVLQNMVQNFGISQAIDLFFINNSDLDFVWIELSQDLFNVINQIYLKQMCTLLSQHESIPVVIISYESDKETY